MKQYVQTDLEADRQVAKTLAALILGGALTSTEVAGDANLAAPRPCGHHRRRRARRGGMILTALICNSRMSDANKKLV